MLPTDYTNSRETDDKSELSMIAQGLQFSNQHSRSKNRLPLAVLFCDAGSKAYLETNLQLWKLANQNNKMNPVGFQGHFVSHSPYSLIYARGHREAGKNAEKSRKWKETLLCSIGDLAGLELIFFHGSSVPVRASKHRFKDHLRFCISSFKTWL